MIERGWCIMEEQRKPNRSKEHVAKIIANRPNKHTEESKKKMKETRKDMVWVFNPTENKRSRIHLEKLGEFVLNGWVRGRHQPIGRHAK